MNKTSINMIFNIFLVSFLLGVFINNIFLDYQISIVISFFIFSFFINLLLYLNNNLKYFIYLFIFLFSFFGGIFISNDNLDKIKTKSDFIEKYDSGFNNELKFEIKQVYKIKDYNIEYIAKLININDLNYKKDILAIISVAKNYDIKVGDLILSRAKVDVISNFNDFDYKNFLLSKNIYFKSNLSFIENYGKVDRNIILKKIEFLREKLLKVIYEVYPKNEAIFLAGILLGARESLEKDIKNNFNNSGLTHFIAVSGFNITILIIFFSFIFKIFPIFLRTILITFVIVVFTFLVGDTAPVIRASIMGLVAYYVLVSGRKGNNFTILMLTAFIMSLFSPFILNYDVSFALSFLAVLGILYTQDFWKKIFKFMPKSFAIQEAFVLTMSAMTFTLPIMLFNFGQISILAPISNVLVTWTIPIAMLLGFLSIIFYLIFPIFGYIVGYFTWLFLKWDMLVVHFFGTRDFSVLKYDFGTNGAYLQITYFIILIFLILYFKPKINNTIKPQY